RPACHSARPTGIVMRVPDPRVIGLLVASLDQPGVLYRLSEVIFRHAANIEYIAGGARRAEVAELQIEVSGAVDEAGLAKDLEGGARDPSGGDHRRLHQHGGLSS